MRKLLFVLLLLPGLALAAGTRYHAPIAGTGGWQGTDYNEASGMVWVPYKSRWIMVTDNNRFVVFEPDGTLEWASSELAFNCSNDSSTDAEGAAIVATSGTYQDVLWVQSENGQGMCRFDIDTLVDSQTVTNLENIDWNLSAGTDAEGLVFVPDRGSTGRYGGFFMYASQGARTIHKHWLHPTNSTTVRYETQNMDSVCGWSAGDISGIDYDFDRKRIYIQSDGNNETCIVNFAMDTLVATTSDPTSSRTFEGSAFGGGRYAFADDGTGGDTTQNGLWLYEDSYCGDDVISSVETCDGTALNGETCSSQGAGSGTLLCKKDCSGYSTMLCTQPSLFPSPIAQMSHLPRFDNEYNIGEWNEYVNLTPSATYDGVDTTMNDNNADVRVVVHDNWNDYSDAFDDDPNWATIIDNDDLFYHDSNGDRIAVYYTDAEANCDPATCQAAVDAASCTYSSYTATTHKCDCRWAIDRGSAAFRDFVIDRYEDFQDSGSGDYGTTGDEVFGWQTDNTSVGWYYRDAWITNGYASARPYYYNPVTAAYDIEQTEDQWADDVRQGIRAQKYGAGNEHLSVWSGCYTSTTLCNGTLECTELSLDWLQYSDGCMLEYSGHRSVPSDQDRFDEIIPFFSDVAKADKYIMMWSGTVGVTATSPTMNSADDCTASTVPYPLCTGDGTWSATQPEWPGSEMTDAEMKFDVAMAMLVYEWPGQVIVAWDRSSWGMDGTNTTYDVTASSHARSVPMMYADIGDPTGDYNIEGTGIYSRAFDTGIVLVNPLGTAQNYTLPTGTYLKVDDTEVSGTISVPAETAFILEEQPSVTVTVDFDTDNGTFVAKGSGFTGNVDSTPVRPAASFLETNLGPTSWRSDYLNTSFTRSFDAGTPQFTYTKLCDVIADYMDSGSSCSSVASGTPWTGTDNTYWKTNVCAAYGTWAAGNGFEDTVWDIWNEPNSAPIFKVGGTGAFTGQNFAATWRDCVNELVTAYATAGETLKVAGPAMADGIKTLAGFLFVQGGDGEAYMDASDYYLKDQIVYESGFGWLAYLDYFDTQMDVLSIHMFGDEVVMDWEEQITILKGAILAEMDVGGAGEMENLVAQWGTDLSGLEIVVTEVFGTTGDRGTCDATYIVDSIVPGHVVTGLGELHEADVDWMTRACWPDPSDCSDGCAGKTLSNLLIQDTINDPDQDPDQERAVWWVYDYYSDMADLGGQEAPVSSDYARVHGVAADDADTTFSALVGFTHMDRNGDLTLEYDTMETLELVLEGLGADCTTASATVKHISPADTEAQFDEADLTVNSTGNVTISGGATTISVSDFDSGDVVYVTVDTSSCSATTRRVIVIGN